MRVIAGAERGITLKTPEGLRTRPTAERVKEGLFSAIQFEIPGTRVLDLFAGTGQLGIEALSRGARDAVFVDMGADACRLVRENLQLSLIHISHGHDAQKALGIHLLVAQFHPNVTPKLVGLLNKIGHLLIVQAGSALHHSLLLIHDRSHSLHAVPWSIFMIHLV